MNGDEPMLGGGAPPTENAPAGGDETRCAVASNARPVPSHASDGTPHPYQCTLCGFSCPTSQGLACHKRSASHIERSQSLA